MIAAKYNTPATTLVLVSLAVAAKIVAQIARHWAEVMGSSSHQVTEMLVITRYH